MFAASTRSIRISPQAHGVLLYPFFLDRVAADAALNQRDGIHPTAAGVDVIVRGILPKAEELVCKALAARKSRGRASVVSVATVESPRHRGRRHEPEGRGRVLEPPAAGMTGRRNASNDSVPLRSTHEPRQRTMPRLFTALEIPADVGSRSATLRGGLPGARWIDPENYHITLRFIGDIDDALAREIAYLLDQVKRRGFELRIDGLSSFGGRKPRAVIAPIPPVAPLH